MTKEKYSRKDIKQPDKVEVFFFEASDYIYRKKTLIFTILAILVAALAAGYGGVKWMQSQEVKKLEAFYTLGTHVKQFNAAQDSKESILNELDGYISNYPDSAQEKLAHFFKAKIYYAAGDLDKSAESAEELLAADESNSTLNFMTGLFVANIYREQKKFDKAVEVLNSLDAQSLDDVRLMELAQTHLLNENQTEARDALQALINEYPNTEYKYLAEQMLATMPAE